MTRNKFVFLCLVVMWLVTCMFLFMGFYAGNSGEYAKGAYDRIFSLIGSDVLENLPSMLDRVLGKRD